jgi:hypothetical protein
VGAASLNPYFIQRLRSAIDELRKRDKELRWPDYWSRLDDLS